MIKSIYTIPKVCKSSKGWYVHFRYNKRQKRYKFGINYIKSLSEKEKEANALAKVLHEKLKKGWNPFSEIEATDDDMTLIEALEFSLKKKKEELASKSYSGYKGTVSFVKDAINSLSLDYITIKETRRAHIKTILEKSKKQRDWSNKAYNKNLNYLKAILSELIEWDIIETNPAYKIKALPTQQITANTPASPEQHKLIKDCLSKNHPHFYNFIISIFHTGIRPNELLQIKIEMINFKKKEIILPPEITKTDKTRIVPINNHHLDCLLAMQLHTYPTDFYLFGSYREPGKGNRGKFIDFIPGPTRIKRDTATKRWKKIVKDGLGIEVNMYSNKHAGANAKIIAGIELDVLRELYGHTSKLMTMRYAKVVKEVYRNEIIEKSPEF